jgi:hypothetical protein
MFMTLYQEIPKESILSELRKRYSAHELDAARLEINELLHSCRTLDQLSERLYPIIRNKTAMNEYMRMNQDSFRSI